MSSRGSKLDAHLPWLLDCDECLLVGTVPVERFPSPQIHAALAAIAQLLWTVVLQKIDLYAGNPFCQPHAFMNAQSPCHSALIVEGHSMHEQGMTLRADPSQGTVLPQYSQKPCGGGPTKNGLIAVLYGMCVRTIPDSI